MKKKKIIAYTNIIGDLFHYGHLQLLKKAKSKSDIHICGIISDKAASEWESPVICNYLERSSVINEIDCVDEIIEQKTIDPSKNLELISNKYPNASILFFPMYQNWNFMPAANIVRKNRGKIMKSSFYDKLSRDNIKKSFIKSTEYDLPERILKSEVNRSFNINFSKAETLQHLAKKLKKSQIENLYVFTLDDWKKSENKILKNSLRILGDTEVIVRSSSMAEDGAMSSKAGMFHSELNVNNSDMSHLKSAINLVIESYQKYKNNNHDQIIIQKQSTNIVMSGVCFTRNIKNNSPYYLINYDDKSSDTTTVTSGLVNDKVEIIKNIHKSKIKKKWRTLIESIREIESIIPDIALDVEFAVNKRNQVIIFQVRPLANSSKFPDHNDNNVFEIHRQILSQYAHINSISSSLIMSDMSFWNPAELIGSRSRPLAASLFKDILMNEIWNSSLKSLKYTKHNKPLLKMLGNKGYICLDATFKTLIPDTMKVDVKRKLKNYYKNQLKKSPQYHDKIEFNIILDSYNFNTEKILNNLRDNNFSNDEISHIRSVMKKHTIFLFNNFDNMIKEDDKMIKDLIKKSKSYSDKDSVIDLLSNIKHNISILKTNGTPQFCRAARLAFLSKNYFNSLCDFEPANKNEVNDILCSIKTVSTDMKNDIIKTKTARQKKIFFKKYGHLRPDTYNILNKRYDRMKNNLSFSKNNGLNNFKIYRLSKRIKNEFDTFFHNIKMNFSSRDILKILKISIQKREEYKFKYTKILSDTIEMIARVGMHLNMSRDDMSFIDINILNQLTNNKFTIEEIHDILKSLSKSRQEEYNLINQVSLPSLIFNKDDLITISDYFISPNFISQKIVEGSVVVIKPDFTGSINNKIVIIENADPGYDWIFSHNIKGLITKYGGVASHMAIRCAEFDLPASIGCGEIIFNKILSYSKVILDCKNLRIKGT